ncbi:YrzI family small protein [Neobacillus sp. LXY-1]
MTLNILFFSITIKKRTVDLNEAIRLEMVDKLYEEHKDRQMTVRPFI